MHVVDEAECLRRLAAAIPPNVREVCTRLANAGHEAVTVGGAVRDAILGRTPGDWDVATSAKPEEVMALFPRTIPTGLQHGTVTIVTGRGVESHVEVTTFRGEGPYSDARRPDHVVLGVPLVDDLARRDLRVNAMAYDPAANRLVDPYGGRRDIEDGTLRAVGPSGNPYDDAIGRFTEDGLRVMRAVRFAAMLELPLDPETERGIVPALPSLAKVSKERISTELRKMLSTRQPSRALAPAARTGIVALILPEVADGWQRWRVRDDDPQQRWLACIDAAPREPSSVRLAAMLLPLAEPAANDEVARRLDRKTVKRAGDVLRRLKFSNEEIAGAAILVGTASVALVEAWTDPEIRRLLADLGRSNVAAAIELWRADGATALAERAAAIAARGDALASTELALTGTELIAALALAPGPLVGRLLAALLDRVLEDPAANQRDTLIALARQLELSLAR